MADTQPTYEVIKICQCGNKDSFPVTEKEAAFELYDIKNIIIQPCRKCGSTTHKYIQLPQVHLDKHMLDIWGKSEELHLMPQDEELLLADMHYFDLVLRGIDENNYLPFKRKVLVVAFCVLLYDSLAEQNETSEEMNPQMHKKVNLLIEEAIKRKEAFSYAADYIPNYLKEVVFPIIGLS
jgi:hypothetical protein